MVVVVGSSVLGLAVGVGVGASVVVSGDLSPVQPAKIANPSEVIAPNIFRLYIEAPWEGSVMSL